jgi:hypothetical protein
MRRTQSAGAHLHYGARSLVTPWLVRGFVLVLFALVMVGQVMPAWWHYCQMGALLAFVIMFSRANPRLSAG